MKCARKECDGLGLYKPTIFIYPEGRPDYDGPPAMMVIDLIVCLEHSKDEVETQRLFDLLLPVIRDTCAAIGKAQPDPQRSKLVWESVQ